MVWRLFATPPERADTTEADSTYPGARLLSTRWLSNRFPGRAAGYQRNRAVYWN
jgi:hypothetical protein